MTDSIIEQILDVARWAPSGDNTQPWRFEITSDTSLIVHGYDTQKEVIYDFGGHASHIAHGMLLETIDIAASKHGLSSYWTRLPNTNKDCPQYKVEFKYNSAPQDALYDHIRNRSVFRRALPTTPLSSADKEKLKVAIGSDYTLVFFETNADRWRIAQTLWQNATIRMTCPEAYPVHKNVIEWNAQFSSDKIPDKAVGTDPLTTKIMKWALQSWRRTSLLNSIPGSTIIPKLEMDLLPALCCAAHVLVIPSRKLADTDDYVRLGRAIQRFWLTATALGLQLQPEMTPVIFRWYAQNRMPLSGDSATNKRIITLSSLFEKHCNALPTTPFGFFCRLGFGKNATARSTRKPLRDLMFLKN